MTLFDMTYAVLKPTWRNKYIGNQVITKRLDCYLIDEGMMLSGPLIKQWVGDDNDSDHFSIFLELKGDLSKPPSLFKFNATQL